MHNQLALSRRQRGVNPNLITSSYLPFPLRLPHWRPSDHYLPHFRDILPLHLSPLLYSSYSVVTAASPFILCCCLSL